jgi:hypothetical protein
MNTNTFRSPAPAANLFNLGGNYNRKNNIVTNVANVVSNAANTATNVVSNVMTNAANTATNAVSNVMNTASNAASNAANAASNVFSMNKASNTASNILSKGPSMIQIVLIVLFVIVFSLFAVFWKDINQGFKVMYDSIRQFFGAAKAPTPGPSDQEDVTIKPEAPQDDTIHEKKLVEKILPGRQEVFNVSKNTYTYYDAEPLCKAMGAELATYEQVKEAYAKGADWCNYGWVKGQMAVYPTQQGTWEQLQQGPEEQRDACGKPGLNGGFFDNPELRFGVNCIGVKPSQKDHDATAIASGEGAPLSPEGLEFEKKINKYRGDASSIAILPFNKSTWSN